MGEQATSRRVLMGPTPWWAERRGLPQPCSSDGLGACLCECPQGAISVVERETLRFDKVAVAARRAALAGPEGAPPTPCPEPGRMPGQLKIVFEASPGPLSRTPVRRGLAVLSTPSGPPLGPSRTTGGLRHWPVQLRLVPATAPFFRSADLLGAEAARP